MCVTVSIMRQNRRRQHFFGIRNKPNLGNQQSQQHGLIVNSHLRRRRDSTQLSWLWATMQWRQWYDPLRRRCESAITTESKTD